MQVMVCVPAVVIGLVNALETVVIAAGDEVPELLEPTVIDVTIRITVSTHK